MENMQKVVTAQDVADHVGCSLASVHVTFGKNTTSKRRVAAGLEEKIFQAARDLGYDPNLARRYGGKIGMDRRWGASPTISELAEKAGCSTTFVSRVFRGDEHVGKEMKAKVLQAAEEIGFVYRSRYKNPTERQAYYAAKAKAEKERKFSLRYAGFKNKEEQDAYMEAMRSMGHSNAQISRKVGLAIQTVRRRIGPQPEDMSQDNRIAGMKHRAAENQRRKVYVDTHLVRTYNNLIVECAQLRDQAVELVNKSDELANEINKMKPQVAKATLSTEKPAELPPAQLYMDAPAAANAVLQ